MHKITLDLDIVGVDGLPIFDPRLSVLARRSDNSPLKQWLMESWQGPGHLDFDSEAEHVNFFLHVVPERYERGALLYSVNGNRIATTKGPLCLPKQPAKWKPQFALWRDLPDSGFSGMKKLLENSSPDFRCGRDSTAGVFANDRFNAVDAEKEEALAKMSLLNLSSRLDVEPMPGRTDPWLSQVNSLLYSDRERVVAEISEQCYGIVSDTAKKKRDGYSGVTVIPAHLKNLQDGTGAQVHEACSIKSGEERANLQLTVAKATRNGKNTFLLDADFDEHSNLLKHFFDVIAHALSHEGTHPVYIHELLRRAFGRGPLGYDLQPRGPIPVTDARMIETAPV